MNMKQCILHGIPLSEANKYRKGGLGKITDFVGLTDYKGAQRQQDQATAAMKAGTEASVAMGRENIKFQREQMEFQKDQYNDWKNVYGDLQENLGEYYKNLNGSSIVSKQLTAQAAEFAQAEKELTQSLAQRGISGSGMEAAARTTMAMQSASSRAGIRASADEQAMQQKAGFLGLGLGQGTQMLGIQAQQASTVGNAFNSMASNQLQGSMTQANNMASYARQNLQGSQAMGQELVRGASNFVTAKYAPGSDFRFKNNITLVKVIAGVNIYTWEWNEFANSYLGALYTPIGVIAQELIHIHPECVGLDKNGYMFVNYKLLKSIIGDF